MTRILFISHDFGRLGAQMVLLHLLRGVKALRPDWELRIVGREPNGVLAPEFAAFGKVDVFWPVAGVRMAGAHQEVLRAELQAWAPDVVLSNTAVNGDVTEFLGLPAPLLVYVHEMRCYLGQLDARRLDALCRRPVAYLVASQAVYDVLVADLKLDGAKIEVLYESLDLAWIDRMSAVCEPAKERAKLGLPTGARVVGTVGRIDERKGWDLFAAMAAQLLAAEDPAQPWHFLWLGHGPSHAALREAFAKLGHADRLLAPGASDNPFPYYGAMDVFVQTSREDPCPLTTLEAAYLGRPVVVFGPSGGAKEVVGQGCGVVRPDFDSGGMAQSVATLARLPDRGRSIGALGPAIIRANHDAAKAAVKLVAHLERWLVKASAMSAPPSPCVDAKPVFFSTVNSNPSAVRLIANYLPQFHPTPENDRFWGAGFTEWTNVSKARPLFPGHYQPHVPADLGFYDLRVPEVREQQAEMARAAGIEAFCYWHYWFGNGRKILERPLQEVLRSGRPDFPFCVGWANESWTGVWHGAPGRTLIEQTYPGEQDWIEHFNYLLPMFLDRRYVRVDGKPLFMVFRPMQMPNVRRFVDCWRELATKHGLPGLFIIAYERDEWPAAQHGFDGATWAHQSVLKARNERDAQRTAAREAQGLPVHVYNYAEAVPWMHGPKCPGVPLADGHFPSIVTGWDNSPRSGKAATILHDYRPEFFREHVRNVLGTVRHRDPQHRIVFVKSWNEWAEGNYLEPEVRYGRAFLDVLREEVATAGLNPVAVPAAALAGARSPAAPAAILIPAPPPPAAARTAIAALHRRDSGGALRGYDKAFATLKDRLIPPLVEKVRQAGRFQEALLLAPQLDWLDERVVEYTYVAGAILEARGDRPLRLLDVGCVLNNAYARPVVEQASELLWLMNPSVERLAYSERIAYLVGDARMFQMPEELRFDLVTCLSTLEHFGLDNTRYGGAPAEFAGLIDDPEKYAMAGLTSIARWVRPGGRLLVSVPFGPFEYLYLAGHPGKPIYYTFDAARLDRLRTALAAEGFTTEVEVFKVVPDVGWVRTSPLDPLILRHAEDCAAAGAVAFLRGERR